MNESIRKRRSLAVRVGKVQVGGGAPIIVQSMGNTPTENVKATAEQIMELAQAGSEMVRFTVKDDAAAAEVKNIKAELLDNGFDVPLIGDFHYNGDKLLTKYPDCADALDKYRINPGNVGFGDTRDYNFKTMVQCAIDHDKPVRIGINWGSLDQELLASMMDSNKASAAPLPPDAVQRKALVESALQNAEKAVQYGLEPDHIVLSVKVSNVPDLVKVYEELAARCEYALHLGITEGGVGSKGIIANALGIGLLASKGIGDTIRVSMTFPGEPRSREVEVAQQVLQVLGIRQFAPQVTSCPGCGRTTTTTYQTLAAEVNDYLRARTPAWRKEGLKGFESMHVSVMGCIVNGPGEGRMANIGISLPGTGEAPTAPVFADGKQMATLKGDAKTLATEFQKLIEQYVKQHYAPGR